MAVLLDGVEPGSTSALDDGENHRPALYADAGQRFSASHVG